MIRTASNTAITAMSPASAPVMAAIGPSDQVSARDNAPAARIAITTNAQNVTSTRRVEFIRGARPAR
jgi:hypothetical protein